MPVYRLQQHLPLAVLKHINMSTKKRFANGCNSTYRLRYGMKGIAKDESDDEDCTSLVTDQRKGETKVIK